MFKECNKIIVIKYVRKKCERKRKVSNNSTLFILLFIIVVIGLQKSNSEFPTDLTCNSVAKRNSYSLNNCQFTNATDIKCQLFGKSIYSSQFLPTAGIVKFTTSLYMKDLVNISMKGEPIQTWWCLGIRSARLETLSELPLDAVDVYDLPSDISGVLISINKESEAFIEFDSNATAGFLQLKDECSGFENMSYSCISRVEGSSYVMAPAENDFAISDHLFPKVMDLYFNKMRGKLKSVSMRSESKGLEASLWMTYLGPAYVERLDASYNYFNNLALRDNLPPSRLANMDSLKYLYLRKCNISGIHTSNFKGIPNLIKLDIADNRFSKTPTGISMLKKLQVLDMSTKDTKVSYFELGEELRTLNSLKELRLSGQPLGNLSRSNLPKSTVLELLDLSYCNINHIKDDTFIELISLQYLDLSYNSLNHLYPNLFQSLTLDAKLYLNYNQLTNGQKLKFKNSIQFLDFSSNSFKSTENIIEIGHIKNLDLSKNAITSWYSIVLFNTNEYLINNLNISHNKLSVINNKMSTSFNSLQNLDIGANPFQCSDCSIKEFQNFIVTKPIEILSLNKTETIQCYSAIKNKDIDILTAEYNATLCEIIPINWFLVAGLPSGFTIILACSVFVVMYIYRYDLLYMKHLVSVKRKNRNYEEKEGCLYDAFVSYCSKDREFVREKLVAQLEHEEEKYILCLHERDFKLGTYIMDNVVSCIEQSRRVILVLSNNYVESQWCKWELQMAQHRIFEDCKDFLILIELEKIERENIPLHLKVLMATKTHLEWPKSGGDNLSPITSFWSRLQEALGPAIAYERVEEERRRQEEVELRDEEEYEADISFPFESI